MWILCLMICFLSSWNLSAKEPKFHQITGDVGRGSLSSLFLAFQLLDPLGETPGLQFALWGSGSASSKRWDFSQWFGNSYSDWQDGWDWLLQEVLDIDDLFYLWRKGWNVKEWVLELEWICVVNLAMIKKRIAVVYIIKVIGVITSIYNW